MSTRYLGGLVRKTPLVLNPALGNAANGIFTIDQAMQAVKNGTWPAYDPYFENTTLLLHGDGTNGAQNNTFLDSSTNNFTITRNGNTTQGTFSPFSQTVWSNYFDGSSYLSFAYSSAFNLGTGSFTWESWVYATNISGIDGLYATSQGENNVPKFVIHLNAGTPSVHYNGLTNGSNLYTTATSSITANAWNHLAFVRNGSTWTWYINGVASGTGSNSTDITFTSQSTFVAYGGEGYFTPFDGYLSNTRLVKGTAVYTSNFTPSTMPLTAISGTSLLTCQSNRFVDNSANAFAITVNGNTSIQPFSPFAPSAAYSAATNGGSGYFDGSGDYLTVSSSSPTDLGTNPFTIECFIYPIGTGQPQFIISNYSNASTGFSLGYRGTDKTFTFNATGDSADITSNSGFATHQWHHIVISGQSGGLAMFVNGVKQGSTFTGSTAFSSSVAARIGDGAGAAGGQPVNGYLASLRVVKGTAVYDPSSSTITVPTAPLTAITNTSLLLNFTNAGILDNTGRNDLETVGNAQISTSVKKFGTGSMYFDGSGDYLLVPSSQLFTLGSSGDFTLECWIYRVGTSGTIATTWTSSLFANRYLLYLNGSNAILWHNDAGGTVINGGTISATTWTHIAVVRNGSTITMYVNGTSVGTQTSAQAFTTQADLRIGGGITGNGNDFNGYIDDLRITKGVARYTANFTPQTSQWQDQ